MLECIPARARMAHMVRDNRKPQAVAGLPEKLLPPRERQAPKQSALWLQAHAEHVKQRVDPAALRAPRHDAGVKGLVLGRLQTGPSWVDGDGPPV